MTALPGHGTSEAQYLNNNVSNSYGSIDNIESDHTPASGDENGAPLTDALLFVTG